jgi:hypothetical protein
MNADLSTAVWRKSSHSGANNNCVEVAVLSKAVWRKSSRSAGNNNCVEVAGNLPGIVAVRDSKDRDGPTLVVTTDQWATFATALKVGRLGIH